MSISLNICAASKYLLLQFPKVISTLRSPPLSGRTPTGLHRTQPIPVDLGGQSVGLPTDSGGFRHVPLQVRSKSGQSPVKRRNGKKWSDWLDLSVHWTSAGLPPDFHQTYKQKRQTRQYFLLFQYFQGPLGMIRVLLFLETTQKSGSF